MIQNHGDFIRSTTPAGAPFPTDPSQQPARVVSNPERPQPHLREGSKRQFPVPDGRLPIPFNAPPQGPRRGDSHSNPVSTLEQTNLQKLMGIPSPGGPVPYSYGTHPVPLTVHQGAFPSTMPRCKKNPMKSLSDDARRQLDIGTGRVRSSYQGDSDQYAPPPPMWSLESTQTPIQFMGHAQYVAQGPGQYWSGHNVPPRHPGIRQPAPQALPLQTYHQQVAPTAQTMNMHGPVPISQAGPSAPPPIQRLYDPAADTQRLALANMTNAEQSQRQQAPEPRPQAGQAPPAAERCKLWIGNIPGELTKDAVMDMLRPCGGLTNVSDTLPKVTGHPEAPKYVFAMYVNP